jgi:hypothetical protein
MQRHDQWRAGFQAPWHMVKHAEIAGIGLKIPLRQWRRDGRKPRFQRVGHAARSLPSHPSLQTVPRGNIVLQCSNYKTESRENRRSSLLDQFREGRGKVRSRME